MKTRPKSFDCVEMMHRAGARILEETKGMSHEEELAYWRKRFEEDRAKLRKATPPHATK